MDVSVFDDPPEGTVEECSLAETLDQIENDLELPIKALSVAVYYVLKLALGAFALCLCVVIYCFALSWLCLFWFQARLFLATSYVLKSFMREPVDAFKTKASKSPRKDDSTPRPPQTPAQKPKREADGKAHPEISNGESSAETQHSKQPAIHQAQALDLAAAAGTTKGTDWAYQQPVHPEAPEEKTFSEHENFKANTEEADAEKLNGDGAVSYGKAKRVRFSSYEFPSIVNVSGTRQAELKEPEFTFSEQKLQLQQPETPQKLLKKTKQQKMEDDQAAWLSRMRSDSDDEAPRKALSELPVGQQQTGKNASNGFAPRAATAPQYSTDQLEAAKKFMRGASRTPQQAWASKQANTAGSKSKGKGPATNAGPIRKDSGFTAPSNSGFASAVPPHLAKLQSIQNEKDQAEKSKDEIITTKTPIPSDVPDPAMEKIIVFEAPKFVTRSPHDDEETNTSEAVQVSPSVIPDIITENDGPEVNVPNFDDTPLGAGSPTGLSSALTRTFTADALKSMNTSQTRETLDSNAAAYQCWQCQRWTPCQDGKEEIGLCAPCESVHTRIGDARNVLAGRPAANEATGPSPVPLYVGANFDQFKSVNMALPFPDQGFPGFSSRNEALRFFGGHPTKKHKPKYPDLEVASSNSDDTSEVLSAIEDDQALSAEAHKAKSVSNDELRGDNDAGGEATNLVIAPTTDKDKQPLSSKKLQKEAKHAAREALKEAWCDREYARTQVNGGHTQERVQGLREATARYAKKRSELMALMGNGVLNDEDASMYPLFGAMELTAPKNRPFTIAEVKAKKKAQKEADDVRELGLTVGSGDGADEAPPNDDGVDTDLLNAMAKAKELRVAALDYFKQGRPQSNIRYTEWKARGDGGLERANKYYNKKRVALLEALDGQLTPDLQAKYPAL